MPTSRPTILVLQPFADEFNDVFELVIRPAAERNVANAFRVHEIPKSTAVIIEQLYEAIENANLILCDLTHTVVALRAL